MNNLAGAFFKQGNYMEAQRLNEETLKIRKRVQGAEHPATLDSMHNLAVVLFAQGHYIEALRLNEETLEISQRVLGPEHPDTLRTMSDLTKTLNALAWTLLTAEPADLRDPAAALGYALRAVEASGGMDAGILDTLALAYHMTGDHTHAVATQLTAIALLSPGESPLRSELEANLARFCAAAAEAEGSAPEASTPGVDDSSR